MVAIALFDASIGETPARKNFEREIPADLTTVAVSEGELPPSPENLPYDGVVISGSQTSVYENREWIRALEAWVREAHDFGIPLLGVCWGHQLLAQALGGNVEDMGEYELGYRTVRRVEASQIFNGVPREFTAFETHIDTVTELPQDARITARNEVGVQGFQLGRTFGVQFHPEYDLDTARWVIENKDLTPERKQAVLETVTAENHAAAGAARNLFENFRRVVAGERVCRIDPR